MLSRFLSRAGTALTVKPASASRESTGRLLAFGKRMLAVGLLATAMVSGIGSAPVGAAHGEEDRIPAPIVRILAKAPTQWESPAALALSNVADITKHRTVLLERGRITPVTTAPDAEDHVRKVLASQNLTFGEGNAAAAVAGNAIQVARGPAYASNIRLSYDAESGTKRLCIILMPDTDLTGQDVLSAYSGLPKDAIRTAPGHSLDYLAAVLLHEAHHCPVDAVDGLGGTLTEEATVEMAALDHLPKPVADTVWAARQVGSLYYAVVNADENGKTKPDSLDHAVTLFERGAAAPAAVEADTRLSSAARVADLVRQAIGKTEGIVHADIARASVRVLGASETPLDATEVRLLTDYLTGYGTLTSPALHTPVPDAARQAIAEAAKAVFAENRARFRLRMTQASYGSDVFPRLRL